jgi:hypothetical protein
MTARKNVGVELRARSDLDSTNYLSVAVSNGYQCLLPFIYTFKKGFDCSSAEKQCFCLIFEIKSPVNGKILSSTELLHGAFCFHFLWCERAYTQGQVTT